MDFKLHKDTNPFLVGALAGAVLAVWVGFDALSWKTNAAAESLIKRQSETAVVSAYARICSAQFNAAKDRDVRLAELKKIDQWSRGEALNKTGFATMFGEKEPTQGVAQACAEQLLPAKG